MGLLLGTNVNSPQAENVDDCLELFMSFVSRWLGVLYRPISYFNDTKLLLNMLYPTRFIVA